MARLVVSPVIVSSVVVSLHRFPVVSPPFDASLVVTITGAARTQRGGRMVGDRYVPIISILGLGVAAFRSSPSVRRELLVAFLTSPVYRGGVSITP